MQINKSYTNFYLNKQHKYVYPTEFVVRSFLANYPNLKFEKPKFGDKVLDIGCGDGRNTRFLCEQGYDVYATEISEEILHQTKLRLKELNLKADFKKGRNNRLPYENDFFDYILAAAVIYYIDEGSTLIENIIEYNRIIKKGGYLIASIANLNSYIFKDSIPQNDGSRLIKKDPYNNRIGYKLHGFSSTNEIKDFFKPYFTDFCFGTAINNYYGIDEQLFYFVCKKR